MKEIWILNHYIETRHCKFAMELLKRNYEVKVFTASTVHRTDTNFINDDGSSFLEKEINKVPFIFVRASNYKGNGADRIKNMLQYSTRILKVSKNFAKPDIIYASSPHPLTWLAGYKLSKHYGAKFIAETRDLWPETFVAMGKMSKNSIPAKILYKIEKFIYQKADKLIFTFPGGKDYVESIGLDSSKVRYINNGVDLEEFNQNKTRYVLEDADLDDDSTFKILYTGSMGIANALNNIVYAAKVLNDRGYKDIKFLLFGDGYQRKELEDYVKVNNISNVKFKGKVDKKYIPGILSKSDLNVIVSEPIYLYKYGVSANKMFDYFASGRPIVSNVECGYDMLEKYKCGITVKGGSAEALAEGILKFYNMPKEEYDTYCNNALKAARDFDFKILTDKLEEVILED